MYKKILGPIIALLVLLSANIVFGATTVSVTATANDSNSTWTRANEKETITFTLSQPLTTAATSSDMEIAMMTIDAAEDFKPMSRGEQEALIARAADWKPLFPRS